MSNLQERNVLLEPWFSVYLDNKKLGEEFTMYITQVQVEDEEDKLPLASIDIVDPKKLWLNDKRIKKDSKLRINLGHKHNNRKLFDGIITHIDGELPETGDPTLTISAIDKGIKLMDERESRSFKKAKVSDVVKIMLKECGLKGTVQDTKAVIDFLPQENETNLEFITRWRKKLKWRFQRKHDGSYYFGSDSKVAGKTKTLGYKTAGMEIINFAPTYQDQETTEDSQVSDVDNNGNIAVYTVRNAKNKVVYKGLTDSSKPLGKV